MEEPVKPTSFTECFCCGKLTFIDLLDEAMMCEYCREQGRTRPSRKRRHYGKKKGEPYKTAVVKD